MGEDVRLNLGETEGDKTEDELREEIAKLRRLTSEMVQRRRAETMMRKERVKKEREIKVN